METDREIKGQESRQKETNMLDMDTVSQNTIRREYDFAPDVKLKECRFCRVMIPKKAKICPNCRMSLKRHWFRNLAAVVFAVAVIGAGGYDLLLLLSLSPLSSFPLSSHESGEYPILSIFL